MRICIFNSPAEETNFENVWWSGMRLARLHYWTEPLYFPRCQHYFCACLTLLPLHPISDRCCNSCEDVREAYRRRGWAFKNPDTIEQCRREGFSQKMQEQKNEGCQVYGFLEVNKVQEDPRQDRASGAVGWPHSTVNRGPTCPQGTKGRAETAGEREGYLPYRWLGTSTSPPGRASSSPMCMVSDLHQPGASLPDPG